MELSEAVLELIRRTATSLPGDVRKALDASLKREESPSARHCLSNLLESAALSSASTAQLCQDTGIPIFFVSKPSPYSSDKISPAIEQAVSRAVEMGVLRSNAVDSLSGRPFEGAAALGIPQLHFTDSKSNALEISLLLKGGGSENVSRLRSLPCTLLKAQRGLNGVRRCVLDAVFKAQGKGCPPYIVAAAVAATPDAAFLHSKKLLIKKIGERNPKPELKKFEGQLLGEINSLGIGPMGLGGETTALDFKVDFLARHPATFFVAVSFSCWCLRRGRLVFEEGEAVFE